VLYFATTLRMPGAGQSLASKLFRIDSSGAHLVDDEGNVASGAPYWDLSHPSVSADGARLVYTAHQFCNIGDVCSFDEESTPKTPPSAPRLFVPADAGGAAISGNGRYAVSYSTILGPVPSGYSPVLIDFSTGKRTTLTQATYGHPQISSTGLLLVTIRAPQGYVPAIISPDGTTTLLGSANLTAISDDGATLAYADAKTGQLFAQATGGPAVRIGTAGQQITQLQLNRDGTRVMFVSIGSLVDPPKPAQLFYARTDGSGLRQLTQVPEGVSEAILSGDGKVAFALTNTGALLRVDTTTGFATTLVESFPSSLSLFGGSPGSLVVFTGFNFPYASATGTPPYSASLSGVSVTVEGKPAPLLQVSSTQIVFQIPWDVPAQPYPAEAFPRAEPMGPELVLPGGGPMFEAAFSLNVYSYFPSLLSLGAPDPVTASQPFAIHQDGMALVTSTHPALLGETVTMFGTGFGAVSPAVPTGFPTPLAPLSFATADVPIQASLRNAGLPFFPLVPSFVGLAPGFVGLYQINLQIPANLSVTPATNILDINFVIPGAAGIFGGGPLPLAVLGNTTPGLRFP
jgi:uncharacterized protein (TIGR03437 family)